MNYHVLYAESGLQVIRLNSVSDDIQCTAIQLTSVMMLQYSKRAVIVTVCIRYLLSLWSSSVTYILIYFLFIIIFQQCK